MIHCEGALSISFPDLLSERHEINGEPLVLNRVEALAHQVLVQAVTVRHPDVAHSLCGTVLPVLHVELAHHVHDGGTNSSACLCTLYHGKRLCHQGCSAHSFDVCRSPRYWVNDGLWEVHDSCGSEAYYVALLTAPGFIDPVDLYCLIAEGCIGNCANYCIIPSET